MTSVCCPVEILLPIFENKCGKNKGLQGKKIPQILTSVKRLEQGLQTRVSLNSLCLAGWK